MIKLVAVDMDGTFLKSIHDYNRERFSKIYDVMKEKQVKFVVASGNQYYQLKSFFPDIHEAISFVAENGALVISENKELFCGKMPDDVLQEVLGFIKQTPEISMILCGRKSAYTSKKESLEFVETGRRYYHRLKVVPEVTTAIEDTFFKFALSMPVEKTTFYLDMFNERFKGKIAAVSSMPGDIDLIIPGLHKANGIQMLQEKWSIKREEVAVFGDGGNDLEMLRHAKYGYAMENASEEAKEAASFLAPSNNDEGVLVILEELLNIS